MRMGNFLRVHSIVVIVMAARPERAGIQHLTVVPTNYEPDLESEHEQSGQDSNADN